MNAVVVDLYVKGSNGLKLRDQRVRKLVQRMRAAMPWLEDSDPAVYRAWAEFEATDRGLTCPACVSIIPQLFQMKLLNLGADYSLRAKQEHLGRATDRDFALAN